MINSRGYDYRFSDYIANKDIINGIKSFDLHNLKHVDSSLYKSLELILGTTVGNDRYIHDYNQYGIRNIPLTGDTLKYIGDKFKAGLYNLDGDRIYSFLNVLDEQTQQTEHTYVYEVLASKTKEFNKVRIPVYIDEGNTTTGIVKDDYIKAILNLDIEINYLERKGVQYPADLMYEANLLYNTGTKDYDQISRHIAQSEKQYFREPYMYKGYGDRTGMETSGMDEYTLTPMSYMTNMQRTGKYSKFTRHRNSRGNHSYRTKVEFFNTADGTLKEVSKLLATKREIMTKHELMEMEDYDSRDRINLVTHQDMVWGVTKSMIGSNSRNLGYDSAIQFMYAMTYLQNFPTVYIGFEEEDSQDVYLDNEKTIIDDKGLKRVGFITVTFLNFKELGLHPSQYNTKDMYARTCCDYSDNSRFNIRIAVPKGVPNLMYKGQSVKGSEIILMPGYVEYDNNKFVTAELGLGPEKPFRVLDDVKHMVIHHGFYTDNTSVLNRIDGSKVNDKDNVLKLYRMAIRNRITKIPYDKNWENAYDNGFTYDREVVCNFGGWVFPPMRLSAIGYATSNSYDNLGLSTVSYVEYDRPYRIGYTEQYTRQYHGPFGNSLTNIYRKAKEKNGIWCNMQLNYMCAREYVGLQPIFKRLLHGSHANTKSGTINNS